MEYKLNEERTALEKEDYISLKQYTYDLYKRGEVLDNKSIQQHRFPQKEQEVFTITALYPYDKEFCKLYEENPNREKYVINNELLPEIVVEFKKYEIRHYLMDKLIEQEMITPPAIDKTEEKGAKK